MARTNKPKGTGLTDQEIVDALVAKNAETAQATADEPAPEPEQPPVETEPTIADRFVQMNELITHERKRTRLSEATLAKMMELAFQYHAWNVQWEAQQQQRQGFNPSVLMGNGEESEELVGPAGEYLTEVADETTEKEATDGS